MDPGVGVVDGGCNWTIIGARAEGVVPPLDEDCLFPVLSGRVRVGDPKFAAMALEVLRRR